jgi:hypothetical protein
VIIDIIVPFSVRKKELFGTVSDEAKKIFEKIKEKPGLATVIAAKGLPDRTTLHKVYATAPGGARRLLFFCRHTRVTTAESPQVPERWVLVFYRNKGDPVGDNMSSKNASFVSQLERNMTRALRDLTASTPETPLYEKF